MLKYCFFYNLVLCSLLWCWSPWQPAVTIIRLTASPPCFSVMDRIELDSIVPVEEVEEVEDNNSPPPYDAAVKKNNYFPEVLMHQHQNQPTPRVVRRPKRTIPTELPFLKLVWSSLFIYDLNDVDFKFEHADYYDLALVLVGILAAVGSGTIVPFMSVRLVSSQVSCLVLFPSLFLGLVQCCSSWWTMSSAAITTSPWLRPPSRERTFPRWVSPPR